MNEPRRKASKVTSGGGKGNASHGRNRGKRANPFFGHGDRLSILSLKDSSQIILELLKDRTELAEFLNSENLNTEAVEKILEILSKLYETPYTQNLVELLTIFQGSSFITKHLHRYIMQLPLRMSEQLEKENTGRHLQIIVRFFQELFKRFPDSIEDLPLDVLSSSAKRVQVNFVNNNDNNNDSTNNSRSDWDLTIDKIDKIMVHRDDFIKQKVSTTALTSIASAPDDFRSTTIFPTREDIFPDKPPFLRKNVIRGRYDNVDHYLDVQFRLLREDYIAPIREGVQEAMGVEEDRSRSLRVYRNVRLIGRSLDSKFGGYLYHLSFDVTGMKRVKWEHSKRFIYGSLLCLIDNESQASMNFVTIAERKVEDLRKGRLDVKFLAEDEPNISTQQMFLMVESPAYFEGYRHVLEGLQSLNEDKLPFQRYLIECNSEVRPPAYLLKGQTLHDENAQASSMMEIEIFENQDGHSFPTNNTNISEQGRSVCYNLESALSCRVAKSVSILNESSWPSPSQVDLNDSQLNAVKAALTEEFVVIQGPPGTGKTFVGLRIAKALLTNKKSWDRHDEDPEDFRDARLSRRLPVKKSTPILVVCYTNHALDQFLEGILEITNNVVRVGGRSNSMPLHRFNLKEWKKMSTQSQLWITLSKSSKDFQGRIRDENSAIEKAFKNALQDHEVLQFLNDEELEQIFQWKHAAWRFRMHVIQAWLEMKDTFESRRHDSYSSDSSESSDSDGDSTKRDRSGNTRDKTVDSCRSSPEVRVESNSKLAYEADCGAIKQNLEDVASDLEDGEIDEYQETLDTKMEDYQETRDEVKIVPVHDNQFDGKPSSELNRRPESPKDMNCIPVEENKYNTDDLEEGEVIDVEDEIHALLTQRKLEDGELEEGELMPEPAIDLTITLATAELHTSPNQHNDEVPRVNLKSLRRDQRSQLYQSWVNRYIKSHSDSLAYFCDQHEQISRQLSEVESIQAEEILKKVEVIGMTTTGAAKHRRILQEIQPKIVIVEEAAEVLEGHVVTALSSHTEHLILIGDHKQLKPNPTVFELAKKYNLDVSLFERMVSNGFTCHALDTQHRMRPLIADVMRIIYPTLIDDDSVCSYAAIKGIQDNLYFIDHNFPESSNEELKSHSNDHEASFVVALCKYLLLQGYKAKSITVLTMYTGQLLNLRNLMPKSTFEGIRVCSVDNFQGEESDIIVLSLVRSNKNGNIGFLNVSNRVCVALSRAKKGLYCIGNISMMAERNKLWKKIKARLEEKCAIGSSLSLCCPKHPKMVIDASTADDFKKAPQGGCLLPCEFRLQCGHACTMFCHPMDRDHTEFRCKKPCLKELCDLKHACKRECHHGKDCGPCNTITKKVIPACKHMVLTRCHIHANEMICPVPCGKTLSCEHLCGGKCGEDCKDVPCAVQRIQMLPCGHEASIMCSTDIESYACQQPCQQLLDCGHRCTGNCHDCHQGTFHIQCKEPCKRVLVCSHECQEPCTRNCPPCTKKCENRCYHSYCSQRECGSLCIPCRERCEWKCRHHKCSTGCGEMCDRERCDRRCRKTIQCGHRCVGLCGETCPKLCRRCDKEELQMIFLGNEDKSNALYIELFDCRHVFEVSDLDYWMEMKNEDKDNEIQLKECPKCKTPIRRSFRYGNIIKKTLADIEAVKKKTLDDQQRFREKKRQLEKQLKEVKRKYPEKLSFENDTTTALGNSVEYSLRRRLNFMHHAGEQSITFENQIKLLPCLYEMNGKFFQGPENVEFVTRSSELLTEAKRITKLLVDKNTMSTQEVTDVSDNIVVLSLNCRFQYLLWHIEKKVDEADVTDEVTTSLEAIKETFSSASADQQTLTDVERAKITSAIEDVCRKLGIGPLTPMERAIERKQIVQAIGLAKGHWFKCRNGHVYAINDCGGAMERGECPECHEVIGGSQHKLEEGNMLAPEMDGATHAAWSHQANLLNYDPEELRQLWQF